ncbi:hypothetical protein PPACK8108_LOCUS8960 [Phakopsora pachyrhizi]|uniref:Uncharacterized protein n=1 Tax=Phakopsora pachyrhizi TaxID=170000 RepID=A0AAV0AZ08_PHAPC|nr:hypothetical protein PPACK8108_LOCUS8960 [Phakopsora pachyrhizi]
MEQMIKPPQITYSSLPPSAPSTPNIHHHHHQTNQASAGFICSDDLDGSLACSVLVNNIGGLQAITSSSSDVSKLIGEWLAGAQNSSERQSGWPGVEELDNWRGPLSSSSNIGAPTTTTMGFVRLFFC